jgi:uncharacterized protein (TIGR02594 family)
MTRINRDTFVKELADGIDLQGMSQDTRAALAGAGIDARQMSTLAGRDGVIGSHAELSQLFALLDRVDHDGSTRSIALAERGSDGADAKTPSGAAFLALKNELANRRATAPLAGPPAEARPEATNRHSQRLATTADDTPWLRVAAGEIGTREAPEIGKANPRIVEYFAATWDKRTEDSGRDNAWCGAFVTWTLTRAGVENAGSVGARGYETFGEPCQPFRGAIAVLQHGHEKHVAFVAGVDKDGALVLLGGNQGNKVKLATLPGYDVIAIRKPAGFDVSESLHRLPTLTAEHTNSTR